jgi:phosphonatase-like hydrolase
MGIKLVVFDMAGTTIEDNDNVHEALINGFKQYGLHITRGDANSVMGYPKPVAIRTLLEEKFKQRDNIGARVSEIHNAFEAEMVSFYQSNSAVKAKAHAEETFKQLKAKGVKVCLDTGFSRDIADTIIERMGWNKAGLLDLTVTSDEVNNGRPYPDMIFKAMKDLNIETADEVAKVGDTVSDLKEGYAAQCKYVIGITTGAYKRNELEKEPHTHLIDDLLEVVDIVTAN